MSVIVSAIGVVSGIVTIVGFTQANLPQNPPAQGAVVRIGIGGGNEECGGDRPYVVGFNEGGEAVGLTEGGDKVKDGAAFDMILDQNAAGVDHTGEQPTYLQITPSGDDSVCIAYVSVTWQPDGQSRGWTGEVGDACGYKSYASNLILGEDGYKPKCVWMDKNHDDDTWLGGFQIHTEDFLKKDEDYDKNKDTYCKAPAMLWKHEGDEFDGIGKRSISRRFTGSSKLKNSKRSAYLDSKLVVSPDKQHSARELCSNPNSYGPDFVATYEGYFCDMNEKREWPLCSEEIKTRCFDMDSHTIQDGKRSVKRSFKTVDNWN